MGLSNNYVQGFNSVIIRVGTKRLRRGAPKGVRCLRYRIIRPASGYSPPPIYCLPPRLMELLFPNVVEVELSEGFRVLGGQCRGYALHHRLELAE